MTAARVVAARMRGAAIGVVSGATAVAAHGVGGGAISSGAAVVVLTVACASVGAIATCCAGTGLPTVIGLLCAGQMLGHAALAIGSGHGHFGQLTPTMVIAHMLAIVCAAALIRAAERLFAAVAGTMWQLVVVLIALSGTTKRCRYGYVWPCAEVALRMRAGSGIGNRGPPVTAAAA